MKFVTFILLSSLLADTRYRCPTKLSDYSIPLPLRTAAGRNMRARTHTNTYTHTEIPKREREREQCRAGQDRAGQSTAEYSRAQQSTAEIGNLQTRIIYEVHTNIILRDTSTLCIYTSIIFENKSSRQSCMKWLQQRKRVWEYSSIRSTDVYEVLRIAYCLVVVSVSCLLDSMQILLYKIYCCIILYICTNTQSSSVCCMYE